MPVGLYEVTKQVQQYMYKQSPWDIGLKFPE